MHAGPEEKLWAMAKIVVTDQYDTDVIAVKVQHERDAGIAVCIVDECEGLGKDYLWFYGDNQRKAMTKLIWENSEWAAGLMVVFVDQQWEKGWKQAHNLPGAPVRASR